MQHIVVDIEASGPCPPLYSMLSLGAIHHENPSNTFYTTFRPLKGAQFLDSAMAKSGFKDVDMSTFPLAKDSMAIFNDWVLDIKGNGGVIFVSDTTSFDFAFVNYYFWAAIGSNPFGFAPLSLSNLYKGITKNVRNNMRHLRDTKHTHNALEDAQGNHEAFTKIQRMMR